MLKVGSEVSGTRQKTGRVGHRMDRDSELWALEI